MPDRRKKTNSRPWLWVLLTAVLIAALAVILNETLFRIGKVKVEGLVLRSEEEVLSLCGLENGISYFSVREEDIRAGVSSSRYLVYEGMEKTFPNQLTIRVTERQIRASVTLQNQTYLMDETAFVLEKAGADAGRYIRAAGFSARDVKVGEPLSYTNVLQLSAYTAVMKELIVQEASGVFSEINLADPSDIYLTSASGFLVSLGKPEELRAKLLTVRGVLEYMSMYKMKTGTLDATVPGYVTYMPDGN